MVEDIWLDVEFVDQDSLHGLDVEDLVINYQNLLRLWVHIFLLRNTIRRSPSISFLLIPVLDIVLLQVDLLEFSLSNLGHLDLFLDVRLVVIVLLVFDIRLTLADHGISEVEAVLLRKSTGRLPLEHHALRVQSVLLKGHLLRIQLVHVALPGVQLEREEEVRTVVRVWSRSRVEVDCPSELLHDLLRNHEAESDSIRVELLGALDEPEELEQFVLVLVRDPDA